MLYSTYNVAISQTVNTDTMTTQEVWNLLKQDVKSLSKEIDLSQTKVDVNKIIESTNKQLKKFDDNLKVRKDTKDRFYKEIKTVRQDIDDMLNDIAEHVLDYTYTSSKLDSLGVKVQRYKELQDSVYTKEQIDSLNTEYLKKANRYQFDVIQRLAKQSELPKVIILPNNNIYDKVKYDIKNTERKHIVLEYLKNIWWIIIIPCALSILIVSLISKL